MNVRHVYLDLDRTLFDTQTFMTDVIAILDTLFNIPAGQFLAGLPQFYVTNGNMRYYDFFGQLAAQGVEQNRATPAIRVALAGRNYLYPDAQKLVEAIAKLSVTATVVSFGLQNFQRFKYSLCPALQSIPLKTMLHTKDRYLKMCPPEQSLLVDDKRTTNLPAWCVMVLIDRTAAEHAKQEGAQEWRINSLEAVESWLRVGYNEP